MDIPLLMRLRKQAHREVALLQDEVVEVLYSDFENFKPVLHGGTAIWRCYKGNRFSEDLDFYAKPGSGFKEAFARQMESRGLQISKWKETENLIFVKIANEGNEVRLEINLKKMPKSIVGEFEKANGGVLGIYTLSATALLEEKMQAYQNRRLVRDIYDVYHLSGIAKAPTHLKNFLKNLAPPLDEENLKTIVYSGVAPSFKHIVNVLFSRCPK